MTEEKPGWGLHGGLLALVLVVAGFAYGWRAQSVPLEPYYAAAVRAMAGSWHDFAFGGVRPPRPRSRWTSCRARSGCRRCPCGRSG